MKTTLPTYRRTLIVILATLAFVSAPVFGKDPFGKFEDKEPEIIGALFYADWCTACKQLDPELKAAEKKFINKPVMFVKFDLTNLSTQYQTSLFAKALGIEGPLKDTGVKTGFMLLIDRESGEVVGRIDRKAKADKITAEVTKALEAAS